MTSDTTSVDNKEKKKSSASLLTNMFVCFSFFSQSIIKVSVIVIIMSINSGSWDVIRATYRKAWLKKRVNLFISFSFVSKQLLISTTYYYVMKIILEVDIRIRLMMMMMMMMMMMVIMMMVIMMMTMRMMMIRVADEDDKDDGNIQG